MNFVNQNTTLGKALKTLLWLVVANGAVFALTVVANRSDLFNPATVSAANVALVVVKNFIDPNVKNI